MTRDTPGIPAGFLREAGDSALMLELESRIDPVVNARAIAIAAAARRAAIEGVRDVISTFRSVTVHFNPLKTRLDDVKEALDTRAEARTAEAGRLMPGNVVGTRAVEVPVVYGGADGPDLSEVATFAGISEAEVIQRHAAREYRVFMLGFMPGFPYLGVVDPVIAAPRRSSPRTSVPEASVGIAGLQTGIYPRPTPGGWRIIGRADINLFDETREPPARFEAEIGFGSFRSIASHHGRSVGVRPLLTCRGRRAP